MDIIKKKILVGFLKWYVCVCHISGGAQEARESVRAFAAGVTGERGRLQAEHLSHRAFSPATWVNFYMSPQLWILDSQYWMA